MIIRILVSLMLLAVSIYGSIAVSIPPKDLVGVAPEDEQYYKSATIKCRDGSGSFSKSQLNDDYCDCVDGTDEPGTSACPNGKFYCRNAGHAPLLLYSSRVNDGICDCCDGSDEYDGKIKCPNICWEAGKVAREKLKKKIATYQDGVKIRKRDIEQAKLSLAKNEEELSKLKSEEKTLKELVEDLKVHKERIEKAEEEERLKREQEEKAKREAEEAQRENKTDEKSDNGAQPMALTENDNLGTEDQSARHDDMIGTVEETPSIEDDLEHSLGEVADGDNLSNKQSSINELEQSAAKIDEVHDAADGNVETGSKVEDASKDTDSLSREELGRLVASRWTGEKTTGKTEEVDSTKENEHENHGEIAMDDHDDEYNSYYSDNEEYNQNYDDDDIEDQKEDVEEDDHNDLSSTYKHESDDESDISDLANTSSPSWLEKIQKAARNIFQTINIFQVPVNVSEGARVRKEYDELSSKLTKIQSRISSLTQKLKHDFGPDKEFYSFHGQCFENKESKYTYKVCPFKEATQEEGYSSTRLGKWGKFTDSYRTMEFTNGDKCWNGPDRSLKVKLRCGVNNEITDVDEPSRCEYLALLSTPAVCTEEKLKELQDKLGSMNKEQPKGNDEL